MFFAPPALPRTGIKRAFFTLSFTLAAALQAAPAMAQGVPQPGTSVWLENFSSGSPVAGATAVNIENYADANGVAYTVGTGWDATANECNGWILNSTSAMPSTDNGCNTLAGRTGTAANTDIAWNFLKAMADALGAYQGVAAGSNNVLASMTNPGTGGATTIPTTLQIQANSVYAVTAGHYYVATADFAAIHCYNDTYKPTPTTAWNEAAETIFLLNGATQATLVQSPLTNPCDDAPGNPFTTTAAGTPVYITQGMTAAWLAASSVPTVGIKITNGTTATPGNDVAIDRMEIIDVTPQLDQSFGAATEPVGGTATLTFTITNTDDLLAKDGWSFNEALPAGLTLTGTPTTDCPSGAVTPSGTTAFKVTGNLTAGMASCTVTVQVTSATSTTYINHEGSNVTTLSGLLPPSPAQVTFLGTLPGADMQALVVSGPTPASPGSPDMTVVTECVNNGPAAAADPTCAVAVTGATGTTTCTPSPLPASLAAGAAITCTTTYTQGVSAVTITATAGSTTDDENPANNAAKLMPPAPLSGAGPAAVPTGKELSWLLLLLLTAAAWPALVKRAKR